MNTLTTRIALLTLAVTAAVVLTGCGSSSTAAGVNRQDPRAVADAFATAWAGGDLATACGLTAGAEKDKLTRKSQCTGHGAWTPQTPRAFRSCTFANGSLTVLYQVDQVVDRFLIFTTGVEKQPDGTYAVTALPENVPGEPIDTMCSGATKVVNSG
jgi:hypothetical protein